MGSLHLPVRGPREHTYLVFPRRVVPIGTDSLIPLEGYRASSFTCPGTDTRLPEVERFLWRCVPFVTHDDTHPMLCGMHPAIPVCRRGGNFQPIDVIPRDTHNVRSPSTQLSNAGIRWILVVGCSPETDYVGGAAGPHIKFVAIAPVLVNSEGERPGGVSGRVCGIGDMAARNYLCHAPIILGYPDSSWRAVREDRWHLIRFSHRHRYCES